MCFDTISYNEKFTIVYKILCPTFKYNDVLDKSRDIKLHDYIPELEKCRVYL